MKATVVISEGAAAAILQAGGIRFSEPELESIAERFDEIARALITDHFINRYDERRRLRKLPPPDARARFYADLEGIWIDLPGVSELPTVIYSRRKRYEGAFVAFSRSFAGFIADHIEREIRNAPAPHWRGLVRTLRTLQARGGDGLTANSIWMREYHAVAVDAEDKAEIGAMSAWVRPLAQRRK